MKMTLPPLLLLIALCGFALNASAATTVSCTASASGIVFGLYNPLSTVASASSGTLQITCNGRGNGTAVVSVNVSLTAGRSNSYATRKMFSGTNTLNYNIYWSTAYNQIVGDGTGGSFAGSAGPFLVPAGGSNFATGVLYGLMPAGQDAVPGA